MIDMATQSKKGKKKRKWLKAGMHGGDTVEIESKLQRELMNMSYTPI